MDNNDFEDGELPDSDGEMQDSSEPTQQQNGIPVVNPTAMPNRDTGAIPKSTIQHRQQSQNPNSYRNTKNQKAMSSDESESSQSDDSDDEGALWKRKRQKYVSTSNRSSPSLEILGPPGTNNVFQNPLCNKKPSGLFDSNLAQPKAKKQNNIWGSVLQEQSLTQNFVGGFDVASKGISRERDVESYDYTTALDDTRPNFNAETGEEETAQVANDPFDHIVKEAAVKCESFGATEQQRMRRKRNLKDRIGVRSYDKTKSREHIKATVDDPKEKVVAVIVERLEEPKSELIERVVDTLGNEKSLELLYATEDVESAGGMWTMDGSRRRTPGGVYLQLLKADPSVTKEQTKVIFWDDSERERKKAKVRARRQRKYQVDAATHKAAKELGMDTVEQSGFLGELERYKREKETNAQNNEEMEEEDTSQKDNSDNLDGGNVVDKPQIDHMEDGHISDLEDGETFD